VTWFTATGRYGEPNRGCNVDPAGRARVQGGLALGHRCRRRGRLDWWRATGSVGVERGRSH